MNIFLRCLPAGKKRDTEGDQFYRVIVNFRVSIIATVVLLDANRTERCKLMRRHADGGDVAWTTR